MNPKHIFSGALAVAAILAMTSCGNVAQRAPDTATGAEAKGPTADARTGSQAPAQAPLAQGKVAAPAGAQPGIAAQANGAPGGAPLQGAAALPPVPVVDRMVVKNATLGLSVDDPESSLSQVDQLVKAEQGVIASQTLRTQQDKTFVNLVIQVPPENFEDALAKLRDLRAHGTRVLNDSVSSQDVTAQFVDLDAQYRNLQTTRDAYQKLLERATSITDVITLTREVASVQTQMDQIKGRQNLLSREAGISTINLSLAPVGAAPINPGPLPKPLQAARDAWQALLTGLQGFAVVLIWMGILLPAPVLAIAAGWLIYRRVSRAGKVVPPLTSRVG